MGSNRLSQDELSEWREHPVTRFIRATLRFRLDQERTAATAMYWASNPIPEEKRLAFLRKQGMWEDLFESTVDELNTMMEWKEDDEN